MCGTSEVRRTGKTSCSAIIILTVGQPIQTCLLPRLSRRCGVSSHYYPDLTGDMRRRLVRITYMRTCSRRALHTVLTAQKKYRSKAVTLVLSVKVPGLIDPLRTKMDERVWETSRVKNSSWEPNLPYTCYRQNPGTHPRWMTSPRGVTHLVHYAASGRYGCGMEMETIFEFRSNPPPAFYIAL